jgi:hypothetical protein
VIPERVVDGDAVEDVPSTRVDPQVDVVDLEAGQLGDEVLGGDAAISDVVVQEHSGGVRARSVLDADTRPGATVTGAEEASG